MRPRRKSPVTAKKYDVGDGEFLTVREIAEHLNTKPQVIQSRINNGWTGESLLLPVGQRRKKSQPRTNTSVVAYLLALEFGKRVPSIAEIQSVYPMSESAAGYWRVAIQRAIDRYYDLRHKRKRK